MLGQGGFWAQAFARREAASVCFNTRFLTPAGPFFYKSYYHM
jgi:hypothetical protein